MLKKPSSLVLRELVRFKDSETIEWLQESLTEIRELNDDLEGPEVYRGQGRAKILSQFIKLVDKSTEHLENIHRNENSISEE